MANEITRRNFIKGAAAAAIAVSLSGVLTGCGGGTPGHDEVSVGAFVAKVYDAEGQRIVKTDGTETCQIDAKAKLTYKGSDKGIGKHSSEFKATIGGQSLNTASSKNTFTIDTLVSNTRESTTDLTITFPDVETYQSFLDGTTVVLNIKIDGISENKLYLVMAEKKIVVVNTEPTA